jgi:CRP/FNR family transcriptional regulator, cyclic AMP receptor protein
MSANAEDRPAAARYDPGMVDLRSPGDALAAVPLFGGLDEEGLASLLRGMRIRKFRRNETVFHLGDPGDALFIVMSGSIKITLPADTGEEAILATLRPGDFFGELALLDADRRSATVTATSPMEVIVMTRANFRALDRAMPKVHADVCEKIASYR